MQAIKLIIRSKEISQKVPIRVFPRSIRARSARMRIHNFIRAPAHFEREENGSRNADADDLALALRDEAGSSDGVDGLSMAHAADVSRYARTESAVFDLSFASFRAHPRRRSHRVRRSGRTCRARRGRVSRRAARGSRVHIHLLV